MSFVTDVITYAQTIAADNNFRYRYSWEGNGSGAVAIPYTLDCATFISYAIYCAKGWTWYNQPYSYFWPHISESGFDYFLTNTLGYTKTAYSSSYTPVAGDIIITDETLGHTFMVISSTQIIDANNYFGYGADSIAARSWPTYSTSTFAYVYRYSSQLNIFNDSRGDFSNSTASGITFTWNTLTDPYECSVTGTSSDDVTQSPWQMRLINSPFTAGLKYYLQYSGTNVAFRAYFYDQHVNYSDPVYEFITYSDMEFTIPENGDNFVMSLYVPSGLQVSETVAPQIYEIESGTGTWPSYNSFIVFSGPQRKRMLKNLNIIDMSS